MCLISIQIKSLALHDRHIRFLIQIGSNSYDVILKYG